MPVAYIALGSNLGDRRAHLDTARRALEQLPQTRLTAFSSIHETDPVGPDPQGRYLNAAAALETSLAPEELLNHLHRIEQAAGRERRQKWAARTLDLDILLYGDRIIDTPGLKVPHPHMHTRPFVLKPMAEIAPNARHPSFHRSIIDLASDLASSPRSSIT